MMGTHWRTSRSDLRGIEHLTGSPHVAGCDDSIFLSTYTPFPRSEFAQAMLDILAVCVWAAFGMLGALVIGAPVIILGWFLFFS